MTKSALVVNIIGRVIACALILSAGYGVMRLLGSLSEPPAQAEIRERALRVEVKEAHLTDVPVTITGFGEVRSRDVVRIAPEIPGRVVEIHPRLEIGEIIPTGETLFVVDPRDYAARLKESQAMVEQWRNTIERLQIQYDIDVDRLKTLERSRELAKTEYERVKRLYEEDDVGTQSQVDEAERVWRAAVDLADQLSQTVDLYPVRIEEARNNLSAAQAQQTLAETNYSRTEVRAPFDARIKDVRLELNQYVTPGVEVLTLADDSLLEISVPLDSREARDWLEFDGGQTDTNRAWFSNIKPVPVEVFWTESGGRHRWVGKLHRVEKFDQQTRTLTVVVRIQGDEAVSSDERRLPLVDGMFCRVRIPGRMAHSVVKLPAEAVGFDRDADGYRSAYVAVADEQGALRLRMKKVKESHLDGEFVYVGKHIAEDDLVVTTRLINPIEGALLDVERPGEKQADS